jgi:hypothetical protein
MVRSRIVECVLQRQTSERKRGLSLAWDADLTRLAGDRHLSLDHKVRVGVHQGNNVLIAEGWRLTDVILGWLMFHRRQWSGCALLMENLLVLARKESPHQADYARRLLGMARTKMSQ